MKKLHRYTPVAVAVAAVMSTGLAQAQETLKLDSVVVTSTSTALSKMRSSVSVTDVSEDQIRDLGAHTEAEVLLLIPGIRTDVGAGPGGNSNITVRGLPISSGGSKYVQLQEDGLPTVQFGDMNFGNNDYWTRFDSNIESVESLRGGSASVYASQAPGAVINYISKTGKEEGGSVGFSTGLNYKEHRVDAEVGSHLASDVYYHVGGYFRQGEGYRETTPDSLLGYQIKGNITKEFKGADGYFRANFKLLDEQAPTTPQTFLSANLCGSKLCNFANVPGFNGQTGSQYSLYTQGVPFVNPISGATENVNLNKGITTNVKAVGFEFHDKLDSGYTIDNKFRINSQSGSFNSTFWNPETLNAMQTSLAPGGYSTYVNGPNKGVRVTNANLQAQYGGQGLVSDGTAINVNMHDMSLIANDFSASKKFVLSTSSILDGKAGLYYSRQTVSQTWQVNEMVSEAAQNGALINVYNAGGTAVTNGGMTGFNNQWGGLARDLDAHFTTVAPYLGGNLNVGSWDFDGGVRRESFSSNAVYYGSKRTTQTVNGTSNANVYMIDYSNPGYSDYTIGYTNWSLGANFRVTPDASVFARYSVGNRAVADRLLYSANINAQTGALNGAGGAAAALAPVKQSEVGTRLRGKESWGTYGLSATLFHSTTQEFDYDQTRQDNPNLPNYAGPKLNQLGYKATGVEFESGLTAGAFSLNANLTFSDEQYSQDLGQASLVGKHPTGATPWRFVITPRYQIGNATFGGVVRGVSSSYADGANTISIPGYAVVNAFVNYNFGDGLVGSLNVGNLFNSLAVISGGSSPVSGYTGTNGVYGLGVEPGRTIQASLRYKF